MSVFFIVLASNLLLRIKLIYEGNILSYQHREIRNKCQAITQTPLTKTRRRNENHVSHPRQAIIVNFEKMADVHMFRQRAVTESLVKDEVPA
jgi:transcription initiation factor IIE alpha subunit